jgi:hypothetical protein
MPYTVTKQIRKERRAAAVERTNVWLALSPEEQVRLVYAMPGQAGRQRAKLGMLQST